jgi:heme exporter protein D
MSADEFIAYSGAAFASIAVGYALASVFARVEEHFKRKRILEDLRKSRLRRERQSFFDEQHGYGDDRW